jgi:hypothetical protein
MGWLVMWIVLLVVSAGGIIVSTHGLAFERGVEGEMQALVAAAPSSADGAPRRASEALPAVVERYLTAVGADGAPVRTVRMRHGGEMRTGPEAKWMPVRGQQVFTSDPPSFVWWGRMRVAPGLWVDARDKLVAGKGNMHVLAESIFTLGDVTSPELDQGAALRVLGEMVLFPTSFRDARYVRWEPVDASHARAFLRTGDREVHAVFEFGDDGLPARVSAQRFRDVDGVAVLTPWFGSLADYRDVNGLRVPFRMDATWELESGPFHCIHFVIENIQHERGAALGRERS